MNIVVVTDTLDLGSGGVGTCVNDLCLAFRKRGHRVLLVGVVNYDNQNDQLIIGLEKSGVELYNIGAKSRKEALLFFPKYVNKLIIQLRKWTEGKNSICNVHLKMGVLYGAIASVLISNLKCVETYHNTYHYYHLQCWVLSPIIKKYITVSKTAKEEMHNRFKIPNKRVVAIPNGVDRDTIRKSVRGAFCLDIQEDEMLVLSVGRLSPEKNLLTTIKAFCDLNEVSFKYVVIGDGPEKSKAEDLTTDRIKLLGQINRIEVLEYLSKADIVVMPSLWEGRSILMLEAAAFDTPFIISDVPGLREPFKVEPLRKDEVCKRTSFGYLVKTMDVEAYKSALIDYSKNKELHMGMREEVKKMSLENDMSAVADAYIKQFESLY